MPWRRARMPAPRTWSACSWVIRIPARSRTSAPTAAMRRSSSRAAQAGVDQHAGAAGLDEGAVAGAAAGEDVDLQAAPPARGAAGRALTATYSTPGSGAGARAANRSSISCTIPSIPARIASSLDLVELLVDVQDAAVGVDADDRREELDLQGLRERVVLVVEHREVQLDLVLLLELRDEAPDGVGPVPVLAVGVHADDLHPLRAVALPHRDERPELLDARLAVHRPEDEEDLAALGQHPPQVDVAPQDPPGPDRRDRGADPQPAPARGVGAEAGAGDRGRGRGGGRPRPPARCSDSAHERLEPREDLLRRRAPPKDW